MKHIFQSLESYRQQSLQIINEAIACAPCGIGNCTRSVKVDARSTCLKLVCSGILSRQLESKKQNNTQSVRGTVA